MSIDGIKSSEQYFLNGNVGIFGKSKVDPSNYQSGGIQGVNPTSQLPYNSKIQPVNYQEVTSGINTDPRNSNLGTGALGENALYVNGGRAGGRLNELY